MKRIQKISAVIGATLFCFVLLASLFFVNCAKEESMPTDKNNVEVVKLSNVEAQKAFAAILSKAVSSSVEVRTFLKDEALAQFDNDYDVFYPFVKDKEVYDGKTFRDILLSYCAKEEELMQIEESLLLLNILIPDFRLFWDFSAESWDVSSNDVAVISRDDHDNTIYSEGEAVGSLPSNEIPGFPCLVVKNNERLKVSNQATRAGGATYEFVHDAYDSSKTVPMTRSYSKDVDLEIAESGIAYVKAEDLDPLVIEAWEEFNTLDNRQYQRDYVYYGIDKSNQPGKRKTNIIEEILQFRFNSSWYDIIADQNPDPEMNKVVSPGRGNGSWSEDRIVQEVWQDGSFEIVFKTYRSVEGSVAPQEKTYPIPLKAWELFSIDKARLDFENDTWFRSGSKYTYIVSTDDLKPKWVYVKKMESLSDGDSFFESDWDLYNTSMSATILVYERDISETVKTTHTLTNEYASKLDFGLEGSGTIGGGSGSLVGKPFVPGNIGSILRPGQIGQTTLTSGVSLAAGVDVSVKLNYGFSQTTKNTTTVEITKELASDDLGSTTLNYKFPIIVDDSEKDTKGYRLHKVNTGSMEVVFVPRRL